MALVEPLKANNEGIKERKQRRTYPQQCQDLGRLNLNNDNIRIL